MFNLFHLYPETINIITSFLLEIPFRGGKVIHHLIDEDFLRKLLTSAN